MTHADSDLDNSSNRGIKTATTVSPALEIDEALLRIGGDMQLYTMLLNSFYKTNLDTYQKLQQAWEKKQWKQAEILAHTLKGGASSLGASRLSRIAAKLEKAVETKSEGQQEQECISSEHWAELSSALKEVFTQIETLSSHNSAEQKESNQTSHQDANCVKSELQESEHKTQPDTCDLQQAHQLGNQLQSRLKLGEFPEKDINEFVTMLRRQASDEHLNGLRDAVEMFDDEEALEYLNTILSEIADSQ